MLVPSCSPHDTSDPHKSQDPWFHRRTMATPSVYLLQPISHMTNVGHEIQFIQPTFLHGQVLILACPFTDVLTQPDLKFSAICSSFALLQDQDMSQSFLPTIQLWRPKTLLPDHQFSFFGLLLIGTNTAAPTHSHPYQTLTLVKVPPCTCPFFLLSKHQLQELFICCLVYPIS